MPGRNSADVDRSATQASVIPFRFVQSGLQFCLITTRRSNRWAFPKGRIGKQESVVEAALKEALEEAGLRGTVVGDPVGHYQIQKQDQEHSVVVMLMRVYLCETDWRESGERRRAWVSFDEAKRLLDRPKLIELLHAAMVQLKSAPGDSPARAAIRA